MENKGTISTLLLLVLLFIVGYWFYSYNKNTARVRLPVAISNFIDCERYGYAVEGDRFPRQCRTTDGRVYVENETAYSNYSETRTVRSTNTLIPRIATNSRATAYSSSTPRMIYPTPRTITYQETVVETDDGGSYDTPAGGQGGCYVGGCSQQICSDNPGAMSTCEYREEYACYKLSRCERQSSGQCGWTPTSEFSSCLMSS